jgi:carbonic anhydrase
MDASVALVNGFNRFKQKYFTGTDNLYENLKTSQKPDVLVIACSDSRVDPAILFDSAPGELFVVRNVANLVPPCLDDGGTHGVSTALEFAACSLEVKHIVVLGHSMCGGIRALLDGTSGKFISQWMKIAHEAVKVARVERSDVPTASRARSCEQASIVLSLDNLQTFPCVREGVQDGRVAVHGWYFDIEKGELLGYNPNTMEFKILSS